MLSVFVGEGCGERGERERGMRFFSRRQGVTMDREHKDRVNTKGKTTLSLIAVIILI